MRGNATSEHTRGPLRWMAGHYQGWARLFGYGVAWKHGALPPLFSERYGYIRWLRIPRTPWRVRLLWRGQ